MALAGLDVGTSGTKIVVFDMDGNTIASAHRNYREYGTDGIREIDPQEVIDSVFEVIKEVTGKCSERIEAFAIASLGESSVCLDENDIPLYRSMVTGDKRGIAEVKELLKQFDAKQIMEITGLPPSEMYALPKLMWLKKNTKSIDQAKKILFYEDFVGYTLTGERRVSYSLASRSMMYDIRKKEWNKELMDVIGVCGEQMSEPVPSGTVIGRVLPEIAKKLGLSEETFIITGGHDQICAAFGSGLMEPWQSEDGMGTCEFMVCMLHRMEKLGYMLEKDMPCEPYVFDGAFITSVEITTCGILMNWARDTLFADIKNSCKAADGDFFEYMDRMTQEESITDLLILPQFGSAGNPNINYDAKGLIWGLTVHTTQTQIYRALKESMAYQMLFAYEALAPLGVDVNEISVTGGGAASDFTLQLRADVFNKKIIALQNKEAGALGCMILAGTALKKYASLEEGVKRAVKVRREFVPDAQRHADYMQKYEKYKKIYSLMYKFD